MKQKLYVYSGAFAEVSVYLPSGRRLEAQRGVPVRLLASEAAALTASPDWAPAAPDHTPDTERASDAPTENQEQ